jgi:hypothetical protein
MIKITEQKFAEIIADLLVESEDPENPNPVFNAYNWGLIDAQRVLQGVSIDVVKKNRPK